MRSPASPSVSTAPSSCSSAKPSEASPPPPMNSPRPVPVVEHLTVALRDARRQVLEDVSLSIEPGEILGVVGESGSGKTTLGLAMTGYVRRGLSIADGSIRF